MKFLSEAFPLVSVERLYDYCSSFHDNRKYICANAVRNH